MKKLMMIALSGALLIAGCKKTVEQIYTSPDSVYFDFVPADDDDPRIDSISFSFALFPGLSTDTVFLPVSITGTRMATNRKFKLAVVDSVSTAVPGLHYKALEADYTMPADSGSTLVPIILYASDPALTEKTVRVKFRLMPTTDFTVTTREYDSAKIIFSNRLEKPIWWDPWQGEVGAYSRVKHELFIRASGTTELPPTNTDGSVIPKVLYHTRRFRAFLQDPFKWVADNPAEGYAIEQDANGKYYFFSITNPEKKYELELNPADNRYYFKDENGNRIV